MLKKCFVIIWLLLFTLLPKSAAQANDDAFTDYPLLGVTEAVSSYARNIIRPRISHLPPNDRLLQFLEIINVLLDPEDGIASSGLSVPDFMSLAQDSGRQIVSPDSELLDDVPDNKRERLRILHNKYMLKQVTGIFFGPSASDIVKYRSAFGCSHYARAFIAIVKALQLIEKPTDIRYVISSKYDDYNKCVELKGGDCPTINGHQFVFVKIQENWIALNTNKSNDYVVFPEGFTPDLNLKKTNIPIVFKKLPGIIFLLRKIGKDYSDDCGDSSLAALMNISRSGDANSSELRWDMFFLQKNMSAN